MLVKDEVGARQIYACPPLGRTARPLLVNAQVEVVAQPVVACVKGLLYSVCVVSGVGIGFVIAVEPVAGGGGVVTNAPQPASQNANMLPIPSISIRCIYCFIALLRSYKNVLSRFAFNEALFAL